MTPGVDAPALVADLIDKGYLYLSEIEQTNATTELRKFDKVESLAIVREARSWVPFVERGPKFFALSPTPKGKDMFKRILSKPLHTPTRWEDQ